MILVTGGTGLVGSHLLFKLLGEKQSIRAIYRREHKLESVKKVFSYYSPNSEALFNEIEWVEADINDVPALELAFQNVTMVYHCAAFVSFEPDKYHQLRKTNIGGTANIVNLCVANSVKKLCYVSSIAAIGHPLNSDNYITEETIWNPEYDHSVYAITKYGAEIEVWRGTQEGVDAVIVNPGIILGSGFWKNGGSGSLIGQIHMGFPYYTTGVTAYVAVEDVVDIMLRLMKSDIKNQRFIVISENLSFKDFQNKVAKALHVAPAKKEATELILQIGWRLDWLNHKLKGKRRKLSKQMANSALSKSIYDNSKIKKTLDYKFQPIDDSIEKVCHQYLKDINGPDK